MKKIYRIVKEKVRERKKRKEKRTQRKGKMKKETYQPGTEWEPPLLLPFPLLPTLPERSQLSLAEPAGTRGLSLSVHILALEQVMLVLLGVPALAAVEDGLPGVGV